MALVYFSSRSVVVVDGTGLSEPRLFLFVCERASCGGALLLKALAAHALLSYCSSCTRACVFGCRVTCRCRVARNYFFDRVVLAPPAPLSSLTHSPRSLSLFAKRRWLQHARRAFLSPSIANCLLAALRRSSSRSPLSATAPSTCQFRYNRAKHLARRAV